mmetsp:Transcript_7284/g.19001  ORF Transcript_7284/g.19001 Transcript_7284/m.19001 type:complete len:263 (-) Transcript_7284:716-1504(-)
MLTFVITPSPLLPLSSLASRPPRRLLASPNFSLAARRTRFARIVPTATGSPTSPPHLKLLYFTSPGRALPIRLALHIGGIEFEDETITTREHFLPLKQSGELPYGQVPVLYVGGDPVPYAQSTAILRYAGKLSGLYHEDPQRAMRVDEVIEAVGDISAKVSKILTVEPEKKEAFVEDLVAKVLPATFGDLDRAVGRASGGAFAVGEGMTIADLMIFNMNSGFSRGLVPGIPKDIVMGYPALARVIESVAAHPKVVEYFEATK